MKLGHAFALASVGWYLMVPPVRCCTSKIGEPNYDPLCGATKLEGPTAVIDTRCGADASAPLSGWTLRGSYDTAAQCKAAVPQATVKDSLGNDVAAECIASDDPRLAK